MSKCYMYDRCNHIDCGASFCVKKYKLDYLYDKALIPENLRYTVPMYLDSDFGDKLAFDSLQEIKDNIVDFVEKGKNLYLFSTICGNGKTSWALKLTQTYVEKIWAKCKLECKVLFINVPRYLLALKDNITEKSEYVTHIKENVLNCDLVIWDDISNKYGTEFEMTNLLSIIDSRISNNKANIYTTNISPMELKRYMGDRLASRIANYSTIIGLVGADKRQLIASEK